MNRQTAPEPVGGGPYIPEILYEDNHLIAVHKPAGILTQGDASGAVSLLALIKHYLKRRDGKPGNVFLGMVQRLDRPVSGAIVFAKTSKGARRVSEQIRNRRVAKYYVAVTPAVGTNKVKKEPNTAPAWVELRDELLRAGSTTVVSETRRAGSRSAVLRMTTVFTDSGFAVHLIRLVTGRKHQIRAQLSARGMPIVGDIKYGSHISHEPGCILLHSCRVELLHPTRKTPLIIDCPAASDLLFLFDDGDRAAIQAAIAARLT